MSIEDEDVPAVYLLYVFVGIVAIAIFALCCFWILLE
jgi:hypothetical protein